LDTINEDKTKKEIDANNDDKVNALEQRLAELESRFEQDAQPAIDTASGEENNIVSSQTTIKLQDEDTLEEKEFYWDGTPKFVHRYDLDGNQHGEQLDYAWDGTLQNQKRYNHGDKHGEQKRFGWDGTLLEIANYTDGLKDGLQKTYQWDGTQDSEKYYNNGTPLGGNAKNDLESKNEDDDGAQADVQQTVSNLVDELKKLGIELEPEKIEKLNDKIDKLPHYQ
jgi:antitoxin component YwqK of YwqJK toxin-antitoxin module